ncbi:Dcp1 family protein [Aspergillus candidus]|uniref:PH domain-like protein n=1 Tax=Aspergillus candidus TaxID=41067 RepID=A0A2I2F0G4_ASPCN|nr:PH domain-like protein [Aspergillus candidus]PLB34114.1 PH domain-like protein [Aspergillus candidus]
MTDQQDSPPIPPPLRTNEELNLAVLRRHNPSIQNILSLAPYAVVYIFSATSRQWEKSGIEGTLFVCQLSQGPLGEERYTVFVLNRRGLTNFDVPLTDGENVELTEEYVILKTDITYDSNPNPNGNSNSNNNNTGPSNSRNAKTDPIRIYGLWIYSEPPPNSTAETRTINAEVVRECAVHAGHSLKIARERLEAARQDGMHEAAAATATTTPPLEEVQESVPMGRQISLKDLFGHQRAHDDGWSVRAHHLGPADGQFEQMRQQQFQQQQLQQLQQQEQQILQQQQQHQQQMLLQHFHQSQQPLGYPGPTPAAAAAPPAPPQPQGDVLGSLFRKAGLAYQDGPVQ